jgi:uncharacterized integral membrane protein
MHLSFGLIVVGLVILFVLQNMAVVEVRFLFWSVAVSRALMLMIVFGAGMLVGWLLYYYRQGRRSP